MRKKKLKKIYHEHKKIAEAIEARDADGARKWAEKHIRNFQTEFIKDMKYFSYKE